MNDLEYHPEIDLKVTIRSNCKNSNYENIFFKLDNLILSIFIR